MAPKTSEKTASNIKKTGGKKRKNQKKNRGGEKKNQKYYCIESTDPAHSSIRSFIDPNTPIHNISMGEIYCS